MRKVIGRLIEWFLGYKHEIRISNPTYSPRSGYLDDAGYDLYVSKEMLIPPKSIIDVPAGVILDPIDRLWFEIKARSSTFKVRGLEIQDAVIDRGYRGIMFAIVYNPSDHEVRVDLGDRICQVVPHRLINCTFKYENGFLSESSRGNNGFGSSGS